MGGDIRAEQLAQLAADLSRASGVDLPEELGLWRLAGGRPRAGCQRDADPAWALATALEPLLDSGARRRGAHHTPREVAVHVAELALPDEAARQGWAASDIESTGEQARRPSVPRVVDPACGAGALLLAAGERLAASGMRREDAARHALWGADLDPLAVAVAEAAITLWSGGTMPAPAHLVCADTLLGGPRAWPDPPRGGFDALVANPPFQGQLASSTTRTAETVAQLRERYGSAVTAYVDTAAMFLLAATDLVRPGGSMAIVLPQSIVASRDAGSVRGAVHARASLRELWAPDRQLFAASVHVVVAALDVRAPASAHFGSRASGAGASLTSVSGLGASASGSLDAGAVWAARLADARGVPALTLEGAGTVGDLATAVAGFRDEYYGLVGHVGEAEAAPATAPLVTSGCIDIGACTWDEHAVRFAKRRWDRPVVDLEGLRSDNPKLSAWVDRVRRPKVVVASQTKVIEAAVDPQGTWVPVTPVISVLPAVAADAPRLAAALCSPPVSVWAARLAAGTGMSSTAIRVSAALVLTAPLPLDDAAWDEATDALATHDLLRFADAATAMYCLPAPVADEVRAWWSARVTT